MNTREGRRSRPTLSGIRLLLADESRWTRGTLAVDDDGRDVHPRSDRARAWCLAGAAESCATDRASYWETRAVILDEIRRRKRGNSLQEFNDQATHQELLALLDAAMNGGL